MIKAVASEVKDAKIAVLLIPGIGTVEALEKPRSRLQQFV